VKKLYTAIVASVFALTLYGCSTVEGVGKDIQKGGQAIEGAAKKSS
jgi:entericidin B